jgi:hypothetical protein
MLCGLPQITSCKTLRQAATHGNVGYVKHHLAEASQDEIQEAIKMAIHMGHGQVLKLLLQAATQLSSMLLQRAMDSKHKSSLKAVLGTKIGQGSSIAEEKYRVYLLEKLAEREDISMLEFALKMGYKLPSSK